MTRTNLPSPLGHFFARDLKELTDLRDYYREKRLSFQAAYFKQQSERDVRRDEWWRALPHWLFTASVAIVLVHLLIETPRYLTALAALLPVLGSGIRTWRSAHEGTRNMSRFRAKHVALSNIEQRLRSNRIADYPEAESVLSDLWCAEQIMESEHREWLRLMLEAEWLG